MSGRPGPFGIPGPDSATPTQFRSPGHILLGSGDGPVWDQEAGTVRNRVDLSQCGYFFRLNLESSEMICINIHQQISKMMTNQQ